MMPVVTISTSPGLRIRIALPILKPCSALETIASPPLRKPDIDRAGPVERLLHEPRHFVGIRGQTTVMFGSARMMAISSIA